MNREHLTAVEVLAKMHAGEITVSRYVDELLSRCDKFKSLNAFIFLDPDHARRSAKRADELIGSGKPTGPLLGLPITVKDNIDTADMPTTGGTKALKDNHPTHNAPVVQSLVDAGAIVIGKANLHELALGVTNNNKAFGPSRNPYNDQLISGGSSGGCAAAVSARLVPVGLGTDTGGSVRIPAALCGIVGYRPTTGRYSQEGMVPISNTRDTAGLMTRSVQDVDLLDAVITGAKKRPGGLQLKGLRIGVPLKPFYEDIDPRVATAMAQAHKRLSQYGVELVEADMPDVIRINELAGFPIAFYELITNLERYLANAARPLDLAEMVAQVSSPDVKQILVQEMEQRSVSESLYLEAMNTHRPALQSIYKEYFHKNKVSAIILPTTPLPATPIGIDDTVVINGKTLPLFGTFVRNTDPGSVAGIPGINLPIGVTPDNLPVGMEIAGTADEDDRLIQIALAIEALEPVFPPPVLA